MKMMNIMLSSWEATPAYRDVTKVTRDPGTVRQVACSMKQMSILTAFLLHVYEY
jgi:hypothetical protein